MRSIRIGTRESPLAVWQATEVKRLLSGQGYESELIFIRSEGDLDMQTPLYEMGVTGIFTRALDIALLNGSIDIAVHSMKDVPTKPAQGITGAAVLERASFKDILVYNGSLNFLTDPHVKAVIATSSIRRKAQWLHRYPHHQIEVLRGNVNTRLQKVHNSNWNGAIFAGAGLERIGLRPLNSIDLDWMLPAPAQGAIMVVCREDDAYCKTAGTFINHGDTALCTKLERDFLSTLLGGCSTPISALAELKDDRIFFRGNILSVNGTEKADIEFTCSLKDCTNDMGINAACQLLEKGGEKIAAGIKNGI